MDFGKDINSSWTLNENGDLNIAKDNENLAQSIVNRLNCYKPNLSVYYDDGYGGFLHSYLGRRRTQETLDFMKIEVDTILSQDTRLTSFSSSLSYDPDGIVCIDLVVSVSDDEDVELNLVLNGSDGVVMSDAS